MMASEVPVAGAGRGVIGGGEVQAGCRTCWPRWSPVPPGGEARRGRPGSGRRPRRPRRRARGGPGRWPCWPRIAAVLAEQPEGRVEGPAGAAGGTDRPDRQVVGADHDGVRPAAAGSWSRRFELGGGGAVAGGERRRRQVVAIHRAGRVGLVRRSGRRAPATSRGASDDGDRQGGRCGRSAEPQGVGNVAAAVPVGRRPRDRRRDVAAKAGPVDTARAAAARPTATRVERGPSQVLPPSRWSRPGRTPQPEWCSAPPKRRQKVLTRP